jgi:hypothetical protein
MQPHMLKLLKLKKRVTNYGFKQEKSIIERKLLYILGKSKTALSIVQIENELQKSNSDDGTKYIYEVIKKLTPDLNYIPNILLFKYRDFFENEEETKILNDEEIEKLKESICSKIFFSYHSFFDWKEESELVYVKKKPNVISVGSNKNSKFIEIVLNPINPSTNDFAKLFYKGIELPTIIKRKKEDSFIYSVEEYYNSQRYVDILPMDIKKKDSTNQQHLVVKKDSNIKGKKNYYVLNLRGFLHYLLLNKRNKKNYKEINEVLENLAENNSNILFENEFQGFYEEEKETMENRKSFDTNDFYTHKVKDNFAFLSFYNQYKKCLPDNFTANILIEVANELKYRLEEIEIPDLKHEVTSKFFTNIENYLWESFFYPKISNRDLISDETFEILKKCQEETREYERIWKEKELQEHCNFTKFYREQNFKNEIKRYILKSLDEDDNDIVSIDEILKTSNKKTDIDDFWGIKMNVLEEICENERSDYIIAMKSGDFLIKRQKIEEVKKILKPGMTRKEVKEILNENELFADEVISALIKVTGYKIIKDMKTKQYIIK